MKVSILGVDLELDIYDVDVYERYEHEVREVDRKVNRDEPKGLSTVEKMRYQCHTVKEFFDAVFGEGTSESLFHGKDNIKDCNDAYLAVIEASGGAIAEFNQDLTGRYKDLSTKYAPVEDLPDGTPSTYPVVQRNIGPNAPNRAKRRSSRKKRRH